MGTNREKERERAKKLAESAPPLNDSELAEINALYPAYIFRVRREREIWTTCCGQHKKLEKGEYTDAEHEMMEADHIPEDAGRGNYYSYAQRVAAEGDRRETTPCPYCGRAAYVKELGRTGKRDNLAAWRNVVVLRWHRGFLWARAYTTCKKYADTQWLANLPGVELNAVYRFRVGEAVEATRYWARDFCYMRRMTERPKKLPLPIQEPYHNSDKGYVLVGAAEVAKSPFQYCGCREFFRRGGSYMRFLALCAIAPRQVEMLMKAGLRDAVWDVTEGRRWNAAAFDWREPTPLQSFGLDKREMAEFLAGDKNLEVLGYYKQLRKRGVKCTIAEVGEATKWAPHGKENMVVKRLKDCKIEPRRWAAYMEREAARLKVPKGTMRPNPAQLWIDYIDAAEVLGYDLTNPLMQMPRGIRKKHDAATEAAVPIRLARRSERLGAEELARRAQVTERYGFAMGPYIIRAPVDAQEIVDEGKTLLHCVGGYADRHMSGKLAILFLRLADKPDTPLVTIEMRGTKLGQIHGYKNDVGAKTRPEEKYAEILDPWLAWVQAGSKRDKKGSPVLPRTRQEKQAELAATG